MSSWVVCIANRSTTAIPIIAEVYRRLPDAETESHNSPGIVKHGDLAWHSLQRMPTVQVAGRWASFSPPRRPLQG